MPAENKYETPAYWKRRMQRLDRLYHKQLEANSERRHGTYHRFLQARRTYESMTAIPTSE